MPTKVHLCGEDHRDMSHIPGVQELIFAEQSQGHQVVLALEYAFHSNYGMAISNINKGRTTRGGI